MTSTFTSGRRRTGVGVVLRFRTTEDGAFFIALEREHGGRAMLAVDPALARQLLADYGWQETPTFISVSPLIGLKAAYEESATGMLTKLEPFKN